MLRNARSWRIALLCCVLSLGLQPNVWSAQSGEAELKVAFLFNFLKLTEWPTANTEAASVDICLAHHDPFDEALEILQGRELQGKPVKVRVLESSKRLENCRLLYISSDEKPMLKVWLDAAGTSGILTVSDLPGFIDMGGMIGLLATDSKLKFEVNLEPVQRSQLKLRAQLLQLAHRVEGVKP